MKNKKIAVLYGGLSAEREVSLRSGAAAAKALQEAGFTDVTLIDAGHDLPARLLELRPDVCFNSLHGTFGEDGRIQGMLELMNIPAQLRQPVKHNRLRQAPEQGDLRSEQCAHAGIRSAHERYKSALSPLRDKAVQTGLNHRHYSC
ncbi:MAG: hypothetical protein LRY51_14500 [Geovibrio sp.]|nr:hypothetical protein [Geovibrio sp.]